MKLKTNVNKHLTNAWQRRNLTLPSVMIRITHHGTVIECSSSSEAIAVLKYLSGEESKKIEHRTPGLAAFSPDTVLSTLFGASTVTSAWTRESFWKFLENLGDGQKQILSLLVQKGKATDEEMRGMLKLDSNQALAGVLSGISKQAAVLNIPARAVYRVEDERKAGELTKTYAIAQDFLRIANEMNWPEV
jgi:hypothetical protein